MANGCVVLPPGWGEVDGVVSGNGYGAVLDAVMDAWEEKRDWKGEKGGFEGFGERRCCCECE